MGYSFGPGRVFQASWKEKHPVQIAHSQWATIEKESKHNWAVQIAHYRKGKSQLGIRKQQGKGRAAHWHLFKRRGLTEKQRICLARQKLRLAGDLNQDRKRTWIPKMFLPHFLLRIWFVSFVRNIVDTHLGVYHFGYHGYHGYLWISIITFGYIWI